LRYKYQPLVEKRRGQLRGAFGAWVGLKGVSGGPPVVAGSRPPGGQSAGTGAAPGVAGRPLSLPPSGCPSRAAPRAAALNHPLLSAWCVDRRKIRPPKTPGGFSGDRWTHTTRGSMLALPVVVSGGPGA